jgi:hypothetical protein
VAVIATIFVLHGSFGKSVAAAVSRMAATSVSFVLCLIYLAFLPFHAWAGGARRRQRPRGHAAGPVR